MWSETTLRLTSEPAHSRSEQAGLRAGWEAEMDREKQRPRGHVEESFPTEWSLCSENERDRERRPQEPASGARVADSSSQDAGYPERFESARAGRYRQNAA